MVEINDLIEVREKKSQFKSTFPVTQNKERGRTIEDISCSVEGIPAEPHFSLDDHPLLCLG